MDNPRLKHLLKHLNDHSYLPEFVEWISRIIHGLDHPTETEIQAKFFTAEIIFKQGDLLRELQILLKREYYNQVIPEYDVKIEIGCWESEEETTSDDQTTRIKCGLVGFSMNQRLLTISPAIKDYKLIGKIKYIIANYNKTDREISEEDIKEIINNPDKY